MRLKKLLLALAILLLVAPPAEAAKRFTGDMATEAAGAFISSHLEGYPDDYSPGTLLLRYLAVYQGSFMSNVRFAPSLGHQVVVGKTKNHDDTLEGGACASFQVVVEHFKDTTLKTLSEGILEAPIEINRSDELYGRMCMRSTSDYTVEIRRVSLDVAADRKAFSIPFSFTGGGGGN